MNNQKYYIFNNNNNNKLIKYSDNTSNKNNKYNGNTVNIPSKKREIVTSSLLFSIILKRVQCVLNCAFSDYHSIISTPQHQLTLQRYSLDSRWPEVSIKLTAVTSSSTHIHWTTQPKEHQLNCAHHGPDVSRWGQLHSSTCLQSRKFNSRLMYAPYLNHLLLARALIK